MRAFDRPLFGSQAAVIAPRKDVVISMPSAQNGFKPVIWMYQERDDSWQTYWEGDQAILEKAFTDGRPAEVTLHPFDDAHKVVVTFPGNGDENVTQQMEYPGGRLGKRQRVARFAQLLNIDFPVMSKEDVL